jgi:hypothetical protein
MAYRVRCEFCSLRYDLTRASLIVGDKKPPGNCYLTIRHGDLTIGSLGMLFGICMYTWLWDDLLLFWGPSSTKWDEITCLLLFLIIVLHDVSRVNTTRNM